MRPPKIMAAQPHGMPMSDKSEALMLTPTDIQKLAIAKSKGKRPKYLDEKANDHLLAMIMVLAEELAVTRERADTLERLLENAGMIKREAIENYVPNAEIGLDRQIKNSEFVSRLIRSVRHEIDTLTGDYKSTEEIVDFLQKN